MSIALLGLIIIQYLWISNAVQLKNEEFDRRVYAALNSTVGKLEYKHGLNFFANSLKADSVLLRNMEEVDTGFSDFIINTETISNENGENVKVVVRSSKDTTNGHRVVVKTTTRKKDKPVQEVTVEVPPDLPEPATPPLAPTVPLPPDIQERKEKFMSIVACAADQYAEAKTPWYELVDTNNLLQLAVKEFAANQLPADFTLTLHGGATDSLLYTSSPDTQQAYCVPIADTGTPDEAIVLGVNFPGKSGFIMASILSLLLLSVSFTTIVIAVFAMALILILRQKKVNEITNDFINNMTHELKTPLATIAMTADTLRLPTISGNAEAIQEYAGLIKEETKKLSGHVDRILDAAVSEGKTGRGESIELKPAIENCVTRFKASIEQLQGNISWECPEGIIVKADALKLGYVLDNLVDNAIKYSVAPPEISIAVVVGNQTITIAVKDKGIGISRVDQKLVFDKFYRVHTGNRHDVKGFGLGLSFVKNSVEAWGGEIRVASEPDKGSTFYIKLKTA